MSKHPEKPAVEPVTAQTVKAAKGCRKVSVLTAYDYAAAVIADRGGVDVVLVGDSLGMVMLGRKDTVSVTLDEMIHHTSAVMAGVERALVVCDMPFMTYEQGVKEALENADKLAKRSGVRALKLEGGKNIAPQVKALVEAGLPVMGHVGLTPQRAATLGGFKVQGRTVDKAREILEDAVALEDAGCFSVVLEAVPAPVAEKITARLSIPTIGIGGGVHCDGQVLVYHDMLGLNLGHVPRFVRKYANLGEDAVRAVAAYVEEVEKGTFPGEENSFTMPASELEAWKKD